MPRVSICIPNRNYSRFLADAMKSCLHQTEKDIEIIVIDDDSTDDSVAVARSFDDPRLRVVALEENIGLIANFNRCVAEATSPYVKLLCSDDLLYPTCVQDLADALDANPEAAIAFSDREMLFNDGSTRPLISPLPAGVVDARAVVGKSKFVFNIIGEPSTVMLRKSMFAAIEFDARYKQAPDWEFFLQSLRAAPVVHVPAILSVFRWHESNASWWLKRNGTSVHDFLLLSEELESRSSARKYPPASPAAVRLIRLLCLLRALEMTARNVFNRDGDAALRCMFLARRAAKSLFRRWDESRVAPTDF